MLPRDRVIAALNFQAPDVVALECHPSAAGMYEHGTRLQQLFRDHPHDFGDFSDLPIPQPDPAFLRPEGGYCELRTDPWGVQWRHLIFGIHGHPETRPLDDWANLSTWRPPVPPVPSGPDFERARFNVAQHRKRYYLKAGWGGIFEILHSVRRFEDVLMEVALDTAEINALADRITEYQVEALRYLLALGVDGVQMGDDFGTQEALMVSPGTWRRFFLPRYRRLLQPALDAGVDIFFHSCGQVWELLPDLADNAIWPQINLYDWPALAQRCRELKLAVALHPERSHVMTFGTPVQVRDHIDALAAAFRPREGGSWFYLEIDNGFPLANVEALFDAVARYRSA
jgi:hypothetical protein